jgi:hypothetical protein
MRKSKGAKQINSKELTLIKRFHSLNGKAVTTRSLEMLDSSIIKTLKGKCAHRQLLKEISAKLGVVLFRLQGDSVVKVKSIAINKDLLASTTRVVMKPKVKAITLGSAGMGALVEGFFDEIVSKGKKTAFKTFAKTAIKADVSLSNDEKEKRLSEINKMTDKELENFLNNDKDIPDFKGNGTGKRTVSKKKARTKKK